LPDPVHGTVVGDLEERYPSDNPYDEDESCRADEPDVS
jgi:hypothetical protein